MLLGRWRMGAPPACKNLRAPERKHRSPRERAVPAEGHRVTRAASARAAGVLSFWMRNWNDGRGSVHGFEGRALDRVGCDGHHWDLFLWPVRLVAYPLQRSQEARHPRVLVSSRNRSPVTGLLATYSRRRDEPTGRSLRKSRCTLPLFDHWLLSPVIRLIPSFPRLSSFSCPRAPCRPALMSAQSKRCTP